MQSSPARSVSKQCRLALLSGLALLAGSLGCTPEGEVIYSQTPTAVDADGDSFNRGDDCDDEDASVYPEAPESPNDNGIGDGVDNDCDGKVDEGTDNGDDDFDGYTERQGDCDDTNIVVFPSATDGCDGLDGDCDSYVDEDAADSLEPNDFRSTAVALGDSNNNLTCDFVALNINLLPTAFNSPGPDIDWFTFYVEDADKTGCAFGATATLQGIPPGQTVQMNLYAAGVNTPVAQSSFTADSTADTAVVQYDGSRNGAGDGDYYLEITSPSRSSWCKGGMRLVVQGFAPPIIEIPEP